MKKQFGFHHIIVPAIVLVVALVGFTGYKVFNSNNGSANVKKITPPTTTSLKSKDDIKKLSSTLKSVADQDSQNNDDLTALQKL